MKENTLNGQSADIISENIQKLKQIFPEVFCEETIDFEKLQAVLEEYSDDDKERYNFTWWGKSQALRLAQTPSMGTLRPCKEESKDWDTTENLYIEGDNLEVLKLLQKSYHGKIKMIYIDPPYNTGNDFVYKDDYKDPLKNYLEMTGQVNEGGEKVSTNSEASGRYHTNWLNMMYPRLRLARNLLHEKGVIFISIDDNEIDNLKKLCNETFGEENFIGNFTVENNPKGRKNSKFISVSNEYCLVYAKNLNFAQFKKVIPKHAFDMAMDENGNFIRKSGKRVLVGENFLNNPIKDHSSDKHYSVYYNANLNEIQVLKETSITDCNNELIDAGFKRYITYRENIFIENTYSQQMLVSLFAEGKLDIRENKIYEKHYSEMMQIKSVLSNTKYDAIVNNQKILFELDLKTTSAKQALDKLMNGNVFDFPKNISFIKTLLNLNTADESLVLDFFSGSSTTAHATMELNAEDNGKRKFIMVQLPELTDEKSEADKAGYKNICEIGKERIRRAGEKIKAELRENQSKQPSMLQDDKTVNQDDLDIGFKVFKLDSSNLKKWNPDYEHVEASLLDSIENYVDGRSEMDVVFEIMLKYGIDLTFPIEEFKVGGKKIYSIGFGALMICLDQDITTDVANEIARLKEDLKPEVIRVVFRDNGFKDDSVKTNTKEILRNAGIDEIVSV
ncbi:MAG: site-specific DNA-methyltransferase [Pelolinea sp.]|nr:site-specific DNA-methyltransferase [Pelolinea sp.]